MHRNFSKEFAFIVCIFFLQSCNTYEGDTLSIDDETGTAFSVPTPTIELPPENSGEPFASTTFFDLAQLGYMKAEYFISGTANAYINSNEFASNGYWEVEAAESAEYKTRILVYQPIDANDFNGTVVMEWLNVSGGLDAAVDWVTAHNELIEQGYAWVGVSAQYAGVEGGGILSVVALALKTLNSTRYGSLNHPGDSFSYDIFSQAARGITSPAAIDPMEGRQVKQMIAAGESQSAYRLMTYINAFATKWQLFDGYFVHSRVGSSAPLSEAPQTIVNSPSAVFARNDLDVPVMMLQTETDLFILESYASRQADSDQFRLWEVAGASHADAYTTVVGFSDTGDDSSIANIITTTDPVPGIISCDLNINSGPQHFVVRAAIAALDKWIKTGEAPTKAARLEVTGDPAAFVKDAHGNVVGGVRTPYVDVPTAVLSGEGQSGDNEICFLFGTTALFDDTKLTELYADHASYVEAVRESTERAVESGFILENDGKLIIEAAEKSLVATTGSSE